MGRSQKVIKKIPSDYYDPQILIEAAVDAAIKADRSQSNSPVNNTFKLTERRLYAIPVLEKKIKDDKDLLLELQTVGSKERSSSLVRFHRTGYRVSPDEMLEASISDLESSIEADEHEVSVVRRSMETFSSDPYYETVVWRYIDRYDDDVIADTLQCSTTQVWKQRSRIVRDIAVLLYGAAAL